LTCISDYDAVQEILFGRDGIASCSKGSIPVIIECSTISPAQSESCAVRLKDIGIQMLSCPLMGGPAAAVSGQLVPIVSGNYDAFVQVKPILDSIGSQV